MQSRSDSEHLLGMMDELLQKEQIRERPTFTTGCSRTGCPGRSSASRPDATWIGTSAGSASGVQLSPSSDRLQFRHSRDYRRVAGFATDQPRAELPGPARPEYHRVQTVSFRGNAELVSQVRPRSASEQQGY